MAAIDTWMPWYGSDYLKDTLHLTLEEDGFYRRLLDLTWMGGGAIPADEERLKRMVRVTETQWVSCRFILEDFFYRVGESYRNPRIDREIEKALRRVKVAQENGRKGGRKPNSEKSETQRDTQQEPSGLATGSVSLNPQESSPHPHPHEEPKGSSPFAPSDESPGAVAPPKVETVDEYRKRVDDWFGRFDPSSWQEAYPAVQVALEAKRAAIWLKANPMKRKKQLDRFLANWMGRAQENAKGGTHGTPRRGDASESLAQQVASDFGL